jgi:mono/diheme cytochrome c family protein
MRVYLKSHITLLTGMCLLFTTATLGADPSEPETVTGTSAEGISLFQTQVLPILEKNCFKCHGAAGKNRGGLDLTSRRRLLEGGDSGPAVDLKSPGGSLLLEAINYESYEMPPSGKLTEEQIRLLTRWVKMGAPWPPVTTSQPTHSDEDKEAVAPAITEEARAHWAFQPVVRPAVPDVGGHEWVRSPIDAFVLARLEKADLKPAPAASRQVLIRRAYYDLTGLPPSPDEVSSFVSDDRPDAWPRLVDRLLGSPHYGEKWGRHWLDLVRYAESNSYERDAAKPYVWRYRDYVIDSLNDDKPFDRFLLEQLAGDEIPDRTPETLVATGYYRLGLWDDEPVDPEQALYDGLDDVLKTTGQVFLGLTIDCARCHEHKLDPIPQEDYYRLLAFFQGINPYGTRGGGSVAGNSIRPIGTPDETREHEKAVAAYRERLAEIGRRIKEIEKRVKPDFEPVEHEEFKHETNRVALVRKRAGTVISEEEADLYERLTEERRRLKREPPPPMAEALCVTESGSKARETFVLIRGNAHARGKRVEPGYPQVLGIPDPDLEATSPEAKSCGRRTVLARWLGNSENPLTARVLANRIWQYHFGRGIVRSPNNFGLKGDAPTHPELLDWLAAELVAGGWRLKRMHRMIILSAAYRMSSQATAEAVAADPQNDLFGRFNMRRLTAEEIRDSILAVNGTIDLALGGPSIYTTIPAEVLAGQSRPGNGWPTSAPTDQLRRSMYIHVKRSLRPPILKVFDAAETDATCPVRFATTQPTQALTMLNGRFLQEQARAFADSLLAGSAESPGARVEHVLRRVLQREPTHEEIERGVRLIRSMRKGHRLGEREALANYCLVALNFNEFLFLD